MRINKLLSNYGYCSRKETNRLIEEGRIIVNGISCEKGQWVEETDEILLDGKKVSPKDKIYLAFNKPKGIICTTSNDKENNIIALLNYPEYIFPVGRLDKDSEGLIIMTNDGELANNILFSENYHEKEYIVRVDKEINEEFLLNMSRGVKILDIITRPCIIEKIDQSIFRIILTQGLNRQIRRMCKALGYNVLELKRIRILNIRLEEIEVGKYRKISAEEIQNLKRLILNKGD
ncbi:pseudouridine synthase [Clostridium isatidis]|uniref:Pseudouridine synthase n=1 Tax=Clostridium isatidis TaxID=182773 RepID=A0A343JDV1_9CLOT|nr:RNA pseudouridine synthase [Clostridium isatidis]ASW43709.1 23S rRNA pseudouridine synthase F [Clostridium isatidis]